MIPLNEDPWFPSLTPTDPLNENPWTFPTTPAEDWLDKRPLQPITEEDTIGNRLPLSKPPNTTRVYFINLNGIAYETNGGNFATIGKAANDHGIDILSIAETLLDFQCEKRSEKLLSEILIQHTLNWLRPVVIDNTILTENLEELC
jgi:hypothetical protein